MCDSTTPTSPEPNSRPSSLTPSAASNVTGSDIASSSLSPSTGKLEVGSGEGFGDVAFVAIVSVEEPPLPQAAAATTRNATIAHRARIAKGYEEAPPAGFRPRG